MLQLVICLFIMGASLKFSLPSENIKATFKRRYIKGVFKQNDVMKYSSAPVVKSRKPLHANLLKIALHESYFAKSVTSTVCSYHVTYMFQSESTL